MVHALQEACRTLKVDAMLIDLRPLVCNPPIEVVTSEAAVEVASIDDSSMTADSEAADRAIQSALAAGWFVLRHHRALEFEHYWDNVEQMASYLDTRRHRMVVHPSYADLNKVYANLTATANGGIRLRCRWRTMVAAYLRKTLTQIR